MGQELVLNKDELMKMLNHEVNILLHLTSKVDESKLDYRPTAKQRSLRELVEYLSVFAPIVLRTIHAGVFEMDPWREAWQSGPAAARSESFEGLRQSIGRQRELFADLVAPMSADDLRFEMEMFGSRKSRGEWLVWMLLSHYAAYRMQLFLYLKACGREELSTMNLWGGVDPPPAAN